MGKTKGGGPGSGRVTQSWEKRKFVSKNKVRQLSCRYCKKPIAAQNYSRHLQTAHKDEWDANPGDLREFGDRAISFFNPGTSGGGRQSKTAGAAGGGGGVAGEGESGGGGEAIGEGGGGAAGGVEDGSVDDDLPDANDSLDLEYLNSPRSPSGRISVSSSEDENTSVSVRIDAAESDQGRERSRSRSPKRTELRLIEGKVDEILKKQNIDSPAFPETSTEKRVLQKLDIIKAGIAVKDMVKDVQKIAENLGKLFVVNEDTEEREDPGSEDLFLHCRSIEEIEKRLQNLNSKMGSWCVWFVSLRSSMVVISLGNLLLGRFKARSLEA